MASTCPTESASAELLRCILDGEPWSDGLLRCSLAEDEGRLLFRVVVERLGDLFEPRLCDQYAHLFARIIEWLKPEWSAPELVARYERVRRVRACCKPTVRNIFVLSRVTLGADIAVTSVVIDALRQRYPEAQLYFVGPAKNWQLFEAAEGLQHIHFAYPRAGSLSERLGQVKRFEADDSIVVDPDSRITQLGMLPVCDEEDYFFFESRSYGGDTSKALPQLASEWTTEVFGMPGRAWIAPARAEMRFDAAVSFGVGGNEEKRIGTELEREVLRELTGFGLKVLLDAGAGGVETERAEELAKRTPGVELYGGDFAPFASMISKAALYAGYDSAGGHVAAATGIPLVSVFAGYASERMFQRWSPYGPGVRRIIQAGNDTQDAVLHRTMASLRELRPSSTL